MRSSVLLILGLLSVFCTNVTGASLREIIQEDINLRNAARAKLQKSKNKLKCKPENPKTESKLCEPNPEGSHAANDGVATCKDCSQVCHGWGDPHVSTFATPCTTSLFSKKGKYLFYSRLVEDNNGNVDYENSIQINVKAKLFDNTMSSKQKPFMNAFILRESANEQKELTTNDCKQDSNKNIHGVKWVSSDSELQKNEKKRVKDIKIEYFGGCRIKWGVSSIEVWVKISDSGAENVPSSPNEFPYNQHTKFFANDKGACIDPMHYGLNSENDINSNTYTKYTVKEKEKLKYNCDRQSHLTQKGGEGRTCSCSGECAVYGDPHILDFIMKKTKKVKDSFLLPKPGSRTQAQRVLFSSLNKFAIIVDMDECEFINKAKFYFLKTKYLPDLESCKKKPWNDDWITKNMYTKIIYTAESFCGDLTQTEERKSLIIPNAEEHPDYFNEEIGGYNAGYTVVPESGKKWAWPIPDNKESTATKCLQKIGQKPDKIVYMGSISTVLKCHLSADGMPYFNVCIRNNDMGWESSSSTVQAVDENSFTEMQQYGHTAGWCATGEWDTKDAASSMSLSASSFAHREVGESQVFAVADDTIHS